MQHRRLGRSAIYVSDICMGTMTFGSQADEAESLRILDASFDAGINFYDTAENYPVPPDTKWAGRTEEIVGKWLKTKDRDSIILATKVCGPSHGWIKGSQRAGMTAPLFFNTHPAECRAPDQLVAELESLRARHPSLDLVFEVHEAAVTDLGVMADIGTALRAMNIRLAYDDFGAGQARLLELVEVHLL